MVVTSPDLTAFNYKAIINLSTGTVTTPTPTLTMTDTSVWITGNPIKMIFNVIDPSNVLIHEGDWDAPDITTQGGSFTMNLPVFQQAVEWGLYTIQAYVKDSNGTIFTWTNPDNGHQYKTINVCKIAGSTGQFPPANILVNTDCENQKICASSATSNIYQGVTANSPIAVTGNITFPTAADGTIVVQDITWLPQCYVIALNGRYQINIYQTMTYDLPYDTGIIIKYSYNNDNYQVQCNLELCQVYCDFDKLIAETEKVTEANPELYYELSQKIGLVSALMIQFNEGKKCGVDVSPILQRIIDIGGFKCDCNCFPTAIANTPISDCPITMDVVNECGDTTITKNQSGSNFQFVVRGKTYVFQVTEATLPFLTVEKDPVNCTSTVTIAFTQAMLDILANQCKVRWDESDFCCDTLDAKITVEDGTITKTTVIGDEDCRTGDFKVRNGIFSWQTLPYSATFAASSGSDSIPKYAKDNMGRTVLKGQLLVSASPLPDGYSTITSTPLALTYRPLNPVILYPATVLDQELADIGDVPLNLYIEIAATGVMRFHFHTSNATGLGFQLISLDGLSFPNT